MKKDELDVYVLITTSKQTKKERLVELSQLRWNTRAQVVILDTTCWPMESGELVNTKECGPFDVELTADNTTLIDPKTGLIVDPPEIVDEKDPDGWMKGTMGQYDFLRALADTPIKLTDLCKQYISLAVSRGRYDI